MEHEAQDERPLVQVMDREEPVPQDELLPDTLPVEILFSMLLG